MLLLRLVFDTNCIISAALRQQGPPRTAFVLATTKPARLYVTLQILEEYSEVLARPRLGISKGTRLQMLQLVKNHSCLVTPARNLEVCSDPDDNIFIDCADKSRADYLITGNLKHFPTFWKNTKIITSRELVMLAAPHLLRRSH